MVGMEALISLNTQVMVPIESTSNTGGRYSLEYSDRYSIDLVPETVRQWERAEIIGINISARSGDTYPQVTYSIRLLGREAHYPLSLPHQVIETWQEDFYGKNWRTDIRKDGSGGKPTAF